MRILVLACAWILLGRFYNASGFGREDNRSRTRKVLDSESESTSETGGASLDQELIEFAKLGSITEMQEMISTGANVDQIDESGYSALHYCAMNGWVTCVSILLKADASIDMGSRRSQSALYLTARQGNLEMVKLLLSKGADVYYTNGPAGYTTMFAAVIADSEEIILELISRGADVNAIASNSETPIWVAAFLGKKKSIQVLKENGADVTIRAHSFLPVDVLCECTTVDWFGDTCDEQACRSLQELRNMLD